jgi:hypothetical protein
MPRIDKRNELRRHENCPIGLGYQPQQRKHGYRVSVNDGDSTPCSCRVCVACNSRNAP